MANAGGRGEERARDSSLFSDGPGGDTILCFLGGGGRGGAAAAGGGRAAGDGGGGQSSAHLVQSVSSGGTRRETPLDGRTDTDRERERERERRFLVKHSLLSLSLLEERERELALKKGGEANPAR